jgi:hypothetical protein
MTPAVPVSKRSNDHMHGGRLVEPSTLRKVINNVCLSYLLKHEICVILLEWFGANIADGNGCQQRHKQ